MAGSRDRGSSPTKWLNGNVQFSGWSDCSLSPPPPPPTNSTFAILLLCTYGEHSSAWTMDDGRKKLGWVDHQKMWVELDTKIFGDDKSKDKRLSIPLAVEVGRQGDMSPQKFGRIMLISPSYSNHIMLMSPHAPPPKKKILGHRL